MYYDKLSPEEWAKPIDFGFQERIVQRFSTDDEVKMFERDLLKKWDVVVPDLSCWPPLHFTQAGIYAW